MENSKTSFLNLSLKNGGILGGIFILFTVMVYVLNINMFSIMFSVVYFVVIFGIAVFLIVKTMNSYRDKFLDGKITYLQCFLTGFVLLIVGMYISGIFNYVLYGLIDPEYMPKQVEKFAEMMQNYNMPVDQLEKQVLSMEEKMKPIKQLISSLYTTPIAAAVISAIVSIFIKKNMENIPEDILR